MESREHTQRALDAAIAHLGAQCGTIHLKQAGVDVLKLAASRAIPDPVLAVVETVPWGKGMAGLAAARAVPVDACNIQTTTSSDVRPGARATEVAGAIVVPMMLDGKVVGTFGVGTLEPHTFTETETRWLLERASELARELQGAGVLARPQ